MCNKNMQIILSQMQFAASCSNLQLLCNSLRDLKVLGASTCSFQSHVYPVLSMAGLCCRGTNIVSFSMFQHAESTRKGPTPANFSLIISFIIHYQTMHAENFKDLQILCDCKPLQTMMPYVRARGVAMETQNFW